MPFVPAENTVEVAMVYTQTNQRIQNVFNVLFDSAPDLAALNTLGEDFLDWWTTNLKPLQTSNAVLQKIDLTLLTTAEGLAIEYTTGLPLAGGNTTGYATPNNVTVAVKWSSILRGRSNRGRTYHIGLTDGLYLESSLSLVGQADLLAAYTALLTKINVTGRNLCVVSRVSGGAPRAAAVRTPISAVSIDLTLDSQRRRLPGRGE